MVAISSVIVLAMVAMASGAPRYKPYYDVKNAPSLFEKYIRDYNKHYRNEADKAVHYEAFVQSLEKINRLNENANDATYDINQFADYTPDEMQNMFGLNYHHE